MAPVVHNFDPPDRFVAGTVGVPGERTFFLQARSGARLISVSLEKQQVAVLAERVEQLLDRLAATESGAIPAVVPADQLDSGSLDQPVEEQFRAGTLTLSWDPGAGRVVIELFPLTEQDPDGVETEPEEMVVVKLTPALARAFARRAGQVLAAGRPACPFCGNPIEPEGHLCVRANGFRRRG